MAEPDRQAELAAIFKELAHALTLVRELANLLERVARKLTELDASQRAGPR
jgi:hypothetical protein